MTPIAAAINTGSMARRILPPEGHLSDWPAHLAAGTAWQANTDCGSDPHLDSAFVSCLIGIAHLRHGWRWK
jgi:hypothetical protein